MTVTVAGKKIRIRNPKLWTSEDYAKLTPPDSGSFELRAGKIIHMPAPSILHQTISMNLSLLIGNHIRRHQAGILLAAPVDVVFTLHDVIQPDLIFIRRGNEQIAGNQVNGAPDLVIEILSPSNTPKEMSYKKHIYESTGVQEYWLIDPEKQTVVLYRAEAGEFTNKVVISGVDRLHSSAVQGLEFQVSEIFG